MDVTIILLAGIATLVCYLYYTKIYRSPRPGEPPIPSGHVIWGNAKDFAEHAVSFLLKTQKKVGDVFTIRLLNQYLTIIMDPHNFEAFSKQRAFDFDPIQKQVNWNVFSFVIYDAKRMTKNVGQTVRGQGLTKATVYYGDNLNMAVDNVLMKMNNNSKEWQQDGLRALTSKTIFDAIFYTIFGRSNDRNFNPEVFCYEFEMFHRYFNYLWLGVPAKCFPRAMECLKKVFKQPTAEEFLSRDDASDYLKTAIEHMQSTQQTDTDIAAHNLVYLHVNYNTYKVAFWALNNLLENPEALAALRQEIHDKVKEKKMSRDENETVLLDMMDIESMKVLDSVCNESFRLASGVFMVRSVIKDVNFTTNDGNSYNLRAGDRVAIYPPAIYRNPEIFEDPNVFKYDRFVDASFYYKEQEIKNPIMSFGSLCPGKRLALLQLKWFLMTMVNKFDIEIIDGQKAEYDVQYYGHEILPVVKDIDCRYRLRENPLNMQLTS